MTATRGTSNGNAPGSSYDRRRRKFWLLEHYAADMIAAKVERPSGMVEVSGWWPELADEQAAEWRRVGAVVTIMSACRCYRCGRLLTYETLTVDRIIPGCHGGTYRRENIRPACGPCNSVTGGGLRSGRP